MGIIQHFVRPRPTEEPPPPPVLGLVLTSGLFPVYSGGDELDFGAELVSAGTYIFFDVNIETLVLAASLQSAVLTTTIAYNNYTNWPVETLAPSASFQDAVLTVVIAYINYTNWPVESLAVSASLQGATLA